MRYRSFTYYLLLLVACCAFAHSALAVVTKKPVIALRYHVVGIQDKVVLKNVSDTLLNLRSHLKAPVTRTEANHFNQKAPHFIKDALKPYGYFQASVQSSMMKTPLGWSTQFHVTLGQPLPIQSVQIHIQGVGQKDPVFQKWLAQVPMHAGGTLNTITYEKIKNELDDLATQRGYFSAKMIKSQIRINLIRYTARIIIIFNTGPRSRFGETTFTKTTFNDAFLRRFLTYHAGEPYDAAKLEKTQQGMVTSNYFNQVLIKPRTKHIVNGVVPIRVSLMPRKARQYILGAGYGSDTGFRGTLGLNLRHLGHKGHRLHILVRGSQVNSSVTARYTIPGPNPARDLFSIGGGASHINQSTGNAQNGRFGLTYTLLRDHWRNSFTLAYLTERYNLTNLPITSTTLVYPTWDLSYFNADRAMNPHEGVSISTQVSAADQSLLSQTTFFQALMHLKTLYTIEKTKTRLLFRSDAGHTDIANLVNLPLSLQLLAGGSRSMRGYGYNSIGPGRNLVVGSTEVQQCVYGNLYLAGFVDAGVVGNQNIFQSINVGVGPGVVWLTPVGVIELTYAEAPTQSNKPWTLQFTMGAVL